MYCLEIEFGLIFSGWRRASYTYQHYHLAWKYCSASQWRGMMLSFSWCFSSYALPCLYWSANDVEKRHSFLQIVWLIMLVCLQTRKRVLINAFTVRALRDQFPPARGAGKLLPLFRTLSSFFPSESSEHFGIWKWLLYSLYSLKGCQILIGHIPEGSVVMSPGIVLYMRCSLSVVHIASCMTLARICISERCAVEH